MCCAEGLPSDCGFRGYPAPGSYVVLDPGLVPTVAAVVAADRDALAAVLDRDPQPAVPLERLAAASVPVWEQRAAYIRAVLDLAEWCHREADRAQLGELATSVDALQDRLDDARRTYAHGSGSGR